MKSIQEIAKEALAVYGNGWAIRCRDLQAIAKKYNVDSIAIFKEMVEIEKSKECCHSCGQEL